MPKNFGLLGKTLTHSFSKKYFNEKFNNLGLIDHHYQLFEIAEIDAFESLVKSNPDLVGMNVTIPYKEQVIPYLTSLDSSAQTVGAVNVIKFNADGTRTGFNSDFYGFLSSLVNFSTGNKYDLASKKALVLGTGGASKAVKAALDHLSIKYATVSRNSGKTEYSYHSLSPEVIEHHLLIINTTPVGTYPVSNECPEIPYDFITKKHLLFDLVYNPAVTLFMQKGLDQGALAVNGLEMLHLQAEKAWEIWNS